MARSPTKIICSLILLAVAGCGDERGGESSSLKFVSTPADTVFISVNGEPLTFGMMREQLKFEEAVKRFSENKSGENADEVIHNFVIWRRTNIAPEMVNAILLDEEAGRLGISADKKRVDEGVYSFLGNVGVTSEEEFEKNANLRSGFLRSLISRDVRRNMLLEKLHPDIVNITKDEESEVRSRFEAFNKRADATNAIQRANCTKIISEINAGLDFAAAYGKYNQVEPLAGNGCDWGEFFKLELKANEKLADWVFKAPVGSVGGPFEWEDGYCIIKITDRTDGTEEEYSVSASVASVHLQKITLLYSERLPVPDGKALRKQMSDARRKESLEELVRQLHSTMTLDYPNGTVIDGAD